MSEHRCQRVAEHHTVVQVEEVGGTAREPEGGRRSQPPWSLSSISLIGLETPESQTVLFTAVSIKHSRCSVNR